MSVESRIQVVLKSTVKYDLIQLLVLPVINGLTGFSVIKSFGHGYSSETFLNVLSDLVKLLAYIKIYKSGYNETKN